MMLKDVKGCKASILNDIFPETRGSLIAFFDADSYIPPNLFIDTIAGLDREEAGAMGVIQTDVDKLRYFSLKSRGSDEKAPVQ